MEELREERLYTYADYANWDTDKRYELIDGIPILMAAPTVEHQDLLLELGGQFRDFLKGKPCRVYIAPLDVRLFAQGDDERTVVQPDLLVICDRSKLDKKGCNGAPDLVVEILSPSNKRHDRFVKFQQYQKAGVRECWMLDPEDKLLYAHVLENEKYVVNVYGDTDTAPVQILEGCEVSLTDVFGAGGGNP